MAVVALDRSSSAWTRPLSFSAGIAVGQPAPGLASPAPMAVVIAADLSKDVAGRRRTGSVRALVASLVGHDQPIGGRQQRVEQELAVLGSGVSVADVRVGEHYVVAVAGGVAREAPVVEPE